MAQKEDEVVESDYQRARKTAKKAVHKAQEVERKELMGKLEEGEGKVTYSEWSSKWWRETEMFW